jgi:general secretion pathway protein D
VSSAATIRIDPASTVDGTVDVNVQVADVQDLYGWQFDVAFDRAVVHALSVAEGDFLASGGSTVFIPGLIDNTGGTVSFTAGALVGQVPGVSGVGTLATLRFAGIALGTSPVTLSNVVLLDSASGEIAASVQNGSITIENVVPEPGTTTMLLVATAAFVAMRRFGKL